MLPCLYVLPLTHPCEQPFRSTYLHHAMMDGCVLFLLQHHQGDDNHCCYDNAAHHESNDGTFVWTHIFCKEHLENKPRKRTVSGGDTGRSKVPSRPSAVRGRAPTNEQSMASQVLRSQFSPACLKTEVCRDLKFFDSWASGKNQRCPASFWTQVITFLTLASFQTCMFSI